MTVRKQISLLGDGFYNADGAKSFLWNEGRIVLKDILGEQEEGKRPKIFFKSNWFKIFGQLEEEEI